MFHKQKIGQAIILCGGFGKRLSEITNNKLHKSVVNIGGYPFIYYILSQIYFLRIRREFEKIMIQFPKSLFKDSR